MQPNNVMTPFSNYGPVQDPNAVGMEMADSPAAQGPQAPKPKGNWLTSLLPTGGSIAGGLGGAAAGAAAGSVIPIVGTAAGGLIGGVLGAALGGGGGKVAENAAEGNDMGDGVASTALESGAGQLAGGVLGKVFGKGAQLAKNAAASQIEKNAAKESITGRANALKDVSPKAQSNYKANDSLDHVKNMGFDPTDAEQVRKVAGTSSDVLNDVINRSLADSGPLDLGNYNDLVKGVLTKQSGQLGSFDKVALSRGRLGTSNTESAKLLAELENLGAGVAKTGADPNEIRTLTTKLYELAQDAKPVKSATTGAIDPIQKARYQVYTDLRDEIKKSLYDRPELNDVLKGQVGNLTAEDVGSQQLADHLNTVITQAGHDGTPGAQSLLTELKRNIDISNLGREMGNVRQIASSTGGQARAASDAGVTLSSPEGNGANQAMDLMGMVGSTLKHPLAAGGTLISHTIQNPALLETLGRIGALGKKFAPAAGAGAGAANAQLNADPGIAPGGTMGDMTMQPQAEISGQAGGMPQAGGLSQNDLMTLALYSPQAFSSLVTPSAVNQEKVAAAGTAEQSLMGLQGQSPDMGILSSLAGKLGIGEAGAFQRKAQAAAQQVAAATGTDAGKVESMLTNYMAGGGNIDEAIAQLMGNLQSVKQQNTNGAYQTMMNYGGPSVMSQVPTPAG